MGPPGGRTPRLHERRRHRRRCRRRQGLFLVRCQLQMVPQRLPHRTGRRQGRSDCLLGVPPPFIARPTRAPCRPAPDPCRREETANRHRCCGRLPGLRRDFRMASQRSRGVHTRSDHHPGRPTPPTAPPRRRPEPRSTHCTRAAAVPFPPPPPILPHPPRRPPGPGHAHSTRPGRTRRRPYHPGLPALPTPVRLRLRHRRVNAGFGVGSALRLRR